MPKLHSWLGPELGFTSKKPDSRLKSVLLMTIPYKKCYISDYKVMDNGVLYISELQSIWISTSLNSPFIHYIYHPSYYTQALKWHLWIQYYSIDGQQYMVNNLICICFLTIYTSIIHQNDFLQQYGRRRIEHTVDSSKQSGPCFIMKNYYDTGGRQGRTALKFLFDTSRKSQSRRTIMSFITLFHSYAIIKIII